MKYATASIAIAVAALLTGHAQAADNTGKTREQVRAELAEAQRTGNIVVNNGSGQVFKLNEQFASFYPVANVETSKTRAQVLSELAAAQRTGDIVVNNGSGQVNKLNELFPTFYATKVSDLSLIHI
jgi:hypothetical protein